MTDVRLAWGGPLEALALGFGPVTDVRLAVVGTTRGMTAPDDGGLPKPALLVSYYYLTLFQKERPRYDFRDWVMDSGAFSAKNSGKKIDLAAYIETCRRLLATDPALTEVFSLDVIGDHKASLVNCERMWDAGVPAIPTFHVGEPESALIYMAQTYPKIALGGAVMYRRRRAWAAQCFARVWPKRIHGLGFASEEEIMSLPFHSVDATNWEMLPTAFGRWKSIGEASVRGGKQNLRAEVEWYLRLEQRAKERWAKQMAELDALPVSP